MHFFGFRVFCIVINKMFLLLNILKQRIYHHSLSNSDYYLYCQEGNGHLAALIVCTSTTNTRDQNKLH